MKRNVGYFFLGLLISTALVAVAGTFNEFSPATGILKGDANSPVTTAANSSDVNALYNAGNFRSGQSTPNCNLASGPVVACTDSNATAAFTSVHSRVGNSFQLNGNFTNTVDADFGVTISEVGATSKYAQIGPSVNVPLRIKSRLASQEHLKLASGRISFGGQTSIGYNTSGCSFTASGLVANCNVVGFTSQPACVCSRSFISPETICVAGASSNSVVRFGVNIPGNGGNFDIEWVCVGI